MHTPKLVIKIERGRIFAEANDVSDDDGPPSNTTYARDLTSEPLSKATIDAFMAWVEEKTPRLRDAADFSLFGWHLWEFLFRGEIAEAFAVQMNAAKSRRTPMRLELWIDPGESPAIASVPWEFLYCPPRSEGRDGYFLGTHTSLTFNRTNASTANARDIRITEQPRILIITACPPGFERVLWRPVAECITAAIAARLDAGRPDATPAASPAVRVLHDPEDEAALCEALRWRPHILQFIGHGQQDGSLGKLAMLGGEPVWLSGKQLVGVMDAAAPEHRPRLIVLHACEGARVAGAGLAPRLGFGAVAPTLLGQDIPAVVAMQYEIDQGSAIDFSVKLYSDLLANRPIHQAVQAARLSLMSLRRNVPRAFGTPVLYMSGTDGVMFAPVVAAPRGPSLSRAGVATEDVARVEPARPAAVESAPFTAAGMDQRAGGQ
jgi:hypothetical protein